MSEAPSPDDALSVHGGATGSIVTRVPFLGATLALAAGLVAAPEIVGREGAFLGAVLGALALAGIAFRRSSLSAVVLICIFAFGAATGKVPSQAAFMEADETPIERHISETMPWTLAGYTKGVLLGDRLAIDQHDLFFYRRSGITHLLAISGLHVALIAGLIWAATGLVTKHSFLRGILSAGSIVVYVAGIGAPASALRSGFMILMMIIARIAGRPGNSLNFLFGAAFLTLAFDPGALHDIGFQLSYAAAYGMLVWTRPIMRFLPNRPKAVMELFAGSAAAQALTLPLMLWHFREFAPISFITNVFAIPIFSLLLYAIILALLHVPLAVVIASFLQNALRTTAEFFAGARGASMVAERPDSLLIAVLFGIALTPVVARPGKRIVFVAVLFAIGLAASFTRNDVNGDFMMIDAYNRKGLLSIRNGIARVSDEGLPLAAWKDAVTRYRIAKIEKAYLRSRNSFAGRGFRGIMDFCRVESVSAPKRLEHDSEFAPTFDRIRGAGATIVFDIASDSALELFPIPELTYTTLK